MYPKELLNVFDFISVIIKGGPVMVPLWPVPFFSRRVSGSSSGASRSRVRWKRSFNWSSAGSLLATELGEVSDLPAARVLTAGLQHRNPSPPSLGSSGSGGNPGPQETPHHPRHHHHSGSLWGFGNHHGHDQFLRGNVEAARQPHAVTVASRALIMPRDCSSRSSSSLQLLLQSRRTGLEELSIRLAPEIMRPTGRKP